MSPRVRGLQRPAGNDEQSAALQAAITGNPPGVSCSRFIAKHPAHQRNYRVETPIISGPIGIPATEESMVAQPRGATRHRLRPQHIAKPLAMREVIAAYPVLRRLRWRKAISAPNMLLLGDYRTRFAPCEFCRF